MAWTDAARRKAAQELKRRAAIRKLAREASYATHPVPGRRQRREKGPAPGWYFEIPRSMACSRCKIIKPDPKNWARRAQKDVPREQRVCRRCWNERCRHPYARRRDVRDVIRGRSVAGPALREHRRALGVSSRDFAKRVGWSHSFQVKIESADATNLSRGNAESLSRVLADFP